MRLIIASLLLALLWGCAGSDEAEEVSNSSEFELYETAQRFLKRRNFDQAVQALQLLESRYPFGRYAEQAQLELIYAHYNNYEREAAVEAADRFIRLHPQHPNTDYAYYMKGLAAYEVNNNLFDRLAPGNVTKRDLGYAGESFAEFAQLLARYPESPYAADAQARMIYLRNLMARYEINVANYYFRRGAFLAAVNRGRYVVENFPRTPAVADGLAVMVQGYRLLGLDDLAQSALEVLVLNYPSHPALNREGEFVSDYDFDGPARSLWNRMSFGLMDQPTPPQFSYHPRLGE